jgi:hypothetical protein
LGQAAVRGGLNVDWLVGHAIYGLGLQILRDEVVQLSRSDCEAMLKQVLKLNPNFEPPSDLIDRELVYYRATHGAIDTFMMRSVQRTQLKQSLTQLEIADTICSVTKKLLQTHLAIRLFQLDNDRLPSSLDELVPNYLPAVPQDPFANGPLIYRLSDEGYVLYSVGRNGQDDGGIEQNSSGRVDVLLEPREAAVSENQ